MASARAADARYTGPLLGSEGQGGYIPDRSWFGGANRDRQQPFLFLYESGDLAQTRTWARPPYNRSVKF
jgi:hypothetical protein